jgi:hypothetical protein
VSQDLFEGSPKVRLRRVSRQLSGCLSLSSTASREQNTAPITPFLVVRIISSMQVWTSYDTNSLWPMEENEEVGLPLNFLYSPLPDLQQALKMLIIFIFISLKY